MNMQAENINAENTNSENRFNLIDESWIPIVDAGRVSLKQIFSNPSYRALGGNPVQKIALTKLLLAIAQAAYTPRDDEDWTALGADGMAQKCLDYLEKWHDRFYLYGEKPFLQMREIANTNKFTVGKLMPSIASGNTTLLNQSQIEYDLDDFDKALLLIQLMGFALGGKQVDNSQPLSPGYVGNRNSKGEEDSEASGRPGRSAGYLHSHLLGNSVQKTLHQNLLTNENISNLEYFSIGVGIPPWEQMPAGELCQIAKNIKNSYFGCLVPLCRFIYFCDDSKICNTDGILFDRGSKQAPKRSPDPTITFDPMLNVDRAKGDKITFSDPNKRPWRELVSLLSFLSDPYSQKNCLQHKLCISRVSSSYNEFSIWAGGMNFSNKAGEQFPRGNDDFVESSVTLKSEWIKGTKGNEWYGIIEEELKRLESFEKEMKDAVYSYHCREIKKDAKQKKIKGKKDKRANALEGSASHLYWQLCERKFQELVEVCGIGELEERKSALKKMHQYFANNCVLKTYDTVCPKETARQLDAWAKCRPNLSKYLV